MEELGTNVLPAEDGIVSSDSLLQSDAPPTNFSPTTTTTTATSALMDEAITCVMEDTVVPGQSLEVEAVDRIGVTQENGEEEKDGVDVQADGTVNGNTGATGIRKPKPRYHNSGRQPHEIVRNQRLLKEGFTRYFYKCLCI